jgi:hypothetical protein
MVDLQWGEYNFTEWISDGNLDAQWSVYTTASAIATPLTLYQIWTDDTYVYAATSSGASIVDIASESQGAYISFNGGFKSVYANDDTVFFATTDSGIQYIDKTCINSSINNPVDITSCLYEYSVHTLTSNNVRYVHGSGDFMMCTTTLGVDIIKLEPHGYKSYTTITGDQNPYKCFMTSTGKGYYTVQHTNGSWSVDRINSSLQDWSAPDYTYITGSGILPENVAINDIFVTESTSSNGTDNTLFVATTSGIVIIDEGILDYRIYYTV